MKIDLAYQAIKEKDLETLKTFLETVQPYSSRNQLEGQLQSLLGYAIENENLEAVKYLVCEVGMSKYTLNNWYVKWVIYFKPNYEINKFLTDYCNDIKP
jgi:hypothetical protein